MREGIDVELKTEFINNNMVIPKYIHSDDSGMDLQANITKPIHLVWGERKLIKTGIYVGLPATPGALFNWEIQIRPRSGLALKQGITVTNSPGTIDAGYRGEIGVILHNLGKDKFTINPGDRIAQMVLGQAYKMKFKLFTTLSDTERGEGGYGHTGN